MSQDMGENMKHLESISGDPTAALIICGDVCTKITLLEKTLILCKERFQAGKKLAIAWCRFRREPALCLYGFGDTKNPDILI